MATNSERLLPDIVYLLLACALPGINFQEFAVTPRRRDWFGIVVSICHRLNSSPVAP